jgi:hypothetical protein
LSATRDLRLRILYLFPHNTFKDILFGKIHPLTQGHCHTHDKTFLCMALGVVLYALEIASCHGLVLCFTIGHLCSLIMYCFIVLMTVPFPVNSERSLYFFQCVYMFHCSSLIISQCKSLSIICVTCVHLHHVNDCKSCKSLTVCFTIECHLCGNRAQVDPPASSECLANSTSCDRRNIHS